MKPSTTLALRSSIAIRSYVRGFAENAAGRFSLPVKHSTEATSASKSKLSSVADVDQLIKDNILGLGKSPQVIKDGKPNKLAGKVVTFADPWQSETLDPSDVSTDFSVLLSCGLGGGGSEGNLYKSYFAISRLLDKDEVAVYSSLKDAEGRQERFRKGLPYYYDESYINEEESENFFKQVLQKRFFKDDGKLKDPRKVSDLVLFGFSIGHRENISHMNYLWEKLTEALEKEGKIPSLITKYFDKVALVNIGSPVNWSDKKVSQEILTAIEQGSITPADIKEEHYVTRVTPAYRRLSHINIVNFRSVFDMGTAKPAADFNNFHCNPDLYVPEIFKYNRPFGKEYMYVLGAGKVRELYFEDELETLKHNSLGHELRNYAQAIFDSKSLNSILSLISSPRSDISRSESADRGYLVYDQNRQPSESDIESLQKEWRRELAVREVMRDKHNYNNSR